MKDPSITGRRKFSEGSHTYEKSEKGCPPVDRKTVIDRKNDQYKERVINAETGEVIHSCEELLSKHTGHGTAKNKKTTTKRNKS